MHGTRRVLCTVSRHTLYTCTSDYFIITIILNGVALAEAELRLCERNGADIAPGERGVDSVFPTGVPIRRALVRKEAQVIMMMAECKGWEKGWEPAVFPSGECALLQRGGSGLALMRQKGHCTGNGDSEGCGGSDVDCRLCGHIGWHRAHAR